MNLERCQKNHIGNKFVYRRGWVINAYTYINSRFETGEMGQTGAQTIAFIDTDNKLILCAINTYKNDSVGNTAYVDFHVGGNNPSCLEINSF